MTVTLNHKGGAGKMIIVANSVVTPVVWGSWISSADSDL